MVVAFKGVDPRKDTIRLQVRTAQGETVCCALPPDQWQHLFRKAYGFFDQRMTVCPGIRRAKLADRHDYLDATFGVRVR